MVTIAADFSQVRAQSEWLQRNTPKLFDKAIILWLLMSASEIHARSQDFAQALARGVTGNYAGSFRISPVMGSRGRRKIKIYNFQQYSLVIEHGGSWPDKQPPPGVLDEWVRRIIAPETEEEVRAIAYLIGRSMKAKSQGGLKARKALKIMTTAYTTSKGKMRRWLNQLIEQALRRASRDMGSNRGTD